MKNTLNVETRGDREIVMTRAFDAPRLLVWDALTKPELIQRWLGIVGDTTMPICEVDLRGGASTGICGAAATDPRWECAGCIAKS